jgi:very-short-patch-repair endonuclease
VVHPGVYALTHAPLTARQRWIAATLITPDTVLSHASAAACWGFRPFEPPFETVTRPGSGGPRRVGGLLVARSKTLDGDVTRHEGIAITTAERTLVDLAPYLAAGPLGRAFREAQRLRAATAQGLRSTLSRHRGRRGTRLLEELSRRYSQLPYDRARSDAESRALELLHDARIAPPRMNTRIAGEEADLAWPAHRLVVEIDGAQYHQFRAEDVRKQRTWERAGYRVRRIDSEVVYRQPARLIALAPVASPLVDG